MQLSERQTTALNEKAQFKLYGGAKGGGKTVLLCRWALNKCLKFRGNKLWLGRKRAVDFNNTTLQTWRRFIPANLYKINKQEKRIYVANEGQIDYGGLDDQLQIEKFNSAEYGGFGLDQAEESVREDFAMLRGTLRYILPDGMEPDYEALLTANPREGYLKHIFISNPDQGNTRTGRGRFKFIRALPSDNPFLRGGYVDELREAFKFRPTLLAAYLDGSWDDLASADTCIWPSWIETCRLLFCDNKPLKRVVVCDPAREGDDENVTYVLELTAAGFYRIIHTHIESYTRNVIKTAKRLVKTAYEYGADVICVDAVGLGEGICDYIIEEHEKRFQEDHITLVRFRGGAVEPLTTKDKRLYKNLKTKAWLEAAKLFFQALVVMPDDDVLAGQLTWQKIETITDIQQGVVPKKDLKKAYGSSPDRGDALVMGLYAFRFSKEIKKRYKSTRSEEFWQQVRADLAKGQDDGTEKVGADKGFREV